MSETVIESILPKSQVLNLRLMDKYKSELTTIERLQLCHAEVYLEEKLLELQREPDMYFMN